YLTINYKVLDSNNQERKMAYIEKYLNSNIIPFQYKSKWRSRIKAYFYRKKYHEEWDIIYTGIKHFCFFVNKINLLVKDNNINAKELIDLENLVNHILQKDKLNYTNTFVSRERRPTEEVLYLDNLFRMKNKSSCIKLINAFYEVDSLLSLAKAYKFYKFTMPIVDQGFKSLRFKGLYHPFVQKPQKNDLSINFPTHLLFLTGPNMSGKSTFLKALGISVYLAHIGMGINVEYAEIPLFDDIITDINITDNIDEGYSYFLNEVNRIEEIAKHLKNGKRLFIIIDEMFRGTNAQDSIDCSALIIQQFV